MKLQTLHRVLALSLLVAALTLSESAAPAAVSAQNKASARLAQISDEQYDNAVKMLSQYIKIDTTNPPGNETLGAKYLADILKANGIEAQLFETAPGRSIVYGRLKGSGKKKALVLLNHIDVVPAQAGDWKYPPSVSYTNLTLPTKA